MAYEMEVKEIDRQPAVGIRVTTTQTEIGSTLGQLYPELWSYLEGKGIHPAGPPFARYHDCQPDRIDLEAGFPVSTAITGDERIVATELPGGQVVSTMHVGPYDTLSQAFEALETWFKEQGREMGGAPWEVYWTDPGEEPDPARWRTEVVWPIR